LHAQAKALRLAGRSGLPECDHGRKEVSEMAVPKRRTSKAKRDSRRAQNMKLLPPGLSVCPHCHEPKLPHRVCPNCNYYDGKEIVASEA
jgi:large subunit ribosomal protein L32